MTLDKNQIQKIVLPRSKMLVRYFILGRSELLVPSKQKKNQCTLFYNFSILPFFYMTTKTTLMWSCNDYGPNWKSKNWKSVMIMSWKRLVRPQIVCSLTFWERWSIYTKFDTSQLKEKIRKQFISKMRSLWPYSFWGLSISIGNLKLHYVPMYFQLLKQLIITNQANLFQFLEMF